MNKKSPMSIRKFFFGAIKIIGIVIVSKFVIVNSSPIKDLTADVNQLKEQNKVSLKQDAAETNQYLVERIDAYIEDQRVMAQQEKFVDYENAAQRIDSGKKIYGNVDARFTLVEFSDLECPYCKDFHAKPKTIVDGSDGNVNWEFKHFPLEFHNPVAVIEAQAAECVYEISGNKHFWVFLDEVFAETRGNGQGAGDLVTLAENMGVNAKQFSSCLNNGLHRDRVMADYEQGKSFGVNSTPATFVVDNHTGENVLLKGAQPAEAILAVLQRMIAEPKVPQPEDKAETGQGAAKVNQEAYLPTSRDKPTNTARDQFFEQLLAVGEN